MAQGVPLINKPVWSKVLITRIIERPTAIPDFLNLVQSVDDVLEAAGVVENDNLIRCYDGSRYRLIKPGEGVPRIKIILSPFSEEVPDEKW